MYLEKSRHFMHTFFQQKVTQTDLSIYPRKFSTHSVDRVEAHEAMMTWKRFQHYWPFVRGTNLSSVDSPHKRPVLIFLCNPGHIVEWTSSCLWLPTPWRTCDITLIYCWFLVALWSVASQISERFSPSKLILIYSFSPSPHALTTPKFKHFIGIKLNQTCLH